MIVKSVFDFMLSLILLLFFFPILVLLYIFIRAKLGSPVFFIQKRVGLKGKTFNLIKFRTMLDVKDSEGLPLSDKDRATSFGNFLRSTSLDELPEIFNVLKMDMSFVGPRPLLVEYIPLYSKEQMCRHDTKPGITGWAQVNGRNTISWEDKFKLDVWYVNNRSFWLDVKILLITLKKVISREGVDYSKSSTMPIFTGNNINKNEK
jgi:lipopolysaccharide/colanic/teichoic acid biosynthesis glycosyltransferase